MLEATIMELQLEFHWYLVHSKIISLKAFCSLFLKEINYRLFMFHKMMYYILFYLTLGFIISVLQQIVLQGFPLKLDVGFLEEWLGSSLYIYLYIKVQQYVLRSFVDQFKKQKKYLPLLMKYYCFLQVIGIVLLLTYSILLTAIIHQNVNIRLKDFIQLRFIFVYFFFIHTIIFITGIALRLYNLYNKEREAKYLAEKSFLSAQLQMLRQQLNPHFLFNNLNLIASTIHNNPKLAYNFTKSMASFYRKVLETENAGWVTLKDELKTIGSYLYMLGVRFEDKMIFKIHISDSIALNHLVPDFILQPIVENAVKHNTCSLEKPLKIIIELNEKDNLVIKNSYQPKEKSKDSIGIGWFNIENRYKYLNANAPIKYIENDWFVVEVSLLKNDSIN